MTELTAAQIEIVREARLTLSTLLDLRHLVTLYLSSLGSADSEGSHDAAVGVLLIDADGIYDPRQINDRLVLGMKGTISEMEVATFRQRAQSALRGELTVSEVATLLGVTDITVLRMIRLKRLPATQVCANAPWVLLKADVAKFLATFHHGETPQTCNPNQLTLSFQ
jgi:excisionase family DNA binding protein